MLKGSVGIIRADGSKKLGLGHFIRCLALAEGLEKHGIVPRFLCRETTGDALNWLAGADYAIETFPAGTDFRRDLFHTLAQVALLKASWVLTDLCNLDTLEDIEGYQSYLQGLKDAGVFLITVDDWNPLAFPSDILLNPNYGADELPYPDKANPRYLLGPSYFPFRSEYRQVAARTRPINKVASRVLVTLGGTDYHRSVPKLLRALVQMDRSTRLEVRVAGGLATEPDDETEELIAGFGGRCAKLASGSTLLESLLWCDIAITAGGLTKYESAVTGTPSLIISQVEHQDFLTRRFASEGSCQYIGSVLDLSEKTMVNRIEHLINDYDARARMSAAGKKLVDGQGIDRIIAAIENLHAAAVS